MVTPGLADGFDEETAKQKTLESMPIWSKQFFNENVWPDAMKTFNFDPDGYDKLAYSKLHTDLLANTVHLDYICKQLIVFTF